jgi:type IV pilus assembly protein PilW
MRDQNQINHKGMTLIELLVGLVICAVLIGGIYRLFVAQGKAYTVQDQVVEIQQNIRTAMEIVLKDLRMAGYDDDRTLAVVVPTPQIVAGDHSITLRYEKNGSLYEVAYWADGTSRLFRQDTSNGVTNTEPMLENVTGFDFAYGVDEDEDGAIDDRNGNTLVDDWIPAADVGDLKIVAVRVSLTARPFQVNPDLQSVSPRTLISAVTLRNLSLLR